MKHLQLRSSLLVKLVVIAAFANVASAELIWAQQTSATSFVVVDTNKMVGQDASDGSPSALRIGATQLSLSNQHLDPNENNQVIRAFVPTGTTNANCFVTLGDTSFVQLGTLVFCAPRNPIFGEGVLVSIFYPAPPPPGLILTLTLYQEGARKYGAPVLCTAKEGC